LVIINIIWYFEVMEVKIKQIEELLAKKIERDISLAQYTTYKIGGPAKYFFIAENNNDLVTIITYARQFKIPFYLLSGGSNLLVSDNGYKGLVILNKAKEIIFKKDNKVVADAGVNLLELVNQTVQNGLVGLENLAGIPGSVGGAIRGNAGAYGSETSDNLIGVEVMRGSKQFILNKDQCEFKYRDSVFKHNSDLIISGEWQLKAGNVKELKNKIAEILAKRKYGQPLECPSAGCVFKNIVINSSNQAIISKIKNIPQQYLEYKKLPAAWLIDQSGLKGKRVGDVQISEKHANFLVNLGKAKASEVKALINEIKQEVGDKFGIKLEEEISSLGF